MTERDTRSTSPPNSVQIIETIADHLGTEPTDLDFRFGEHLDPDALDTLLESAPEEDLVVAFTLEDLLITVANDGTIKVRDYTD